MPAGSPSKEQDLIAQNQRMLAAIQAYGLRPQDTDSLPPHRSHAVLLGRAQPKPGLLRSQAAYVPLAVAEAQIRQRWDALAQVRTELERFSQSPHVQHTLHLQAQKLEAEIQDLEISAYGSLGPDPFGWSGADGPGGGPMDSPSAASLAPGSFSKTAPHPSHCSHLSLLNAIVKPANRGTHKR